MNRVTLSQYLRHGEKEQEIDSRDSRTEPYSLTAKGQNELDWIVAAQEIRRQPIRYSDELDIPNERRELWVESEGGFQNSIQLLSESSLLPVPVKVTLYGSEPSLVDQATFYATFLRQPLGPKKLTREVLKQHAGWVAAQVIWETLLDRIWQLTLDTTQQLTLENILGFDMSLTISYEGKKLMYGTQALQKKRQIARLLIGRLFLHIAIAMTATQHDVESHTPGVRPWFLDALPHLEAAGLLNHSDSDLIRQGRMLEVALRYLKEGGAVQVVGDLNANGDLSEASLSLLNRLLVDAKDDGVSGTRGPH